MMEQTVTFLRPEEPARFNPECLERLCNEMGEQRAEHEVACALDMINGDLQKAIVTDPFADPAALAKVARDVARASDKIGMATLARVARDVLACQMRGDDVALAATHSRLIRVGDRSIHAIWDLEDLSG